MAAINGHIYLYQRRLEARMTQELRMSACITTLERKGGPSYVVHVCEVDRHWNITLSVGLVYGECDPGLVFRHVSYICLDSYQENIGETEPDRSCIPS